MSYDLKKSLKFLTPSCINKNVSQCLSILFYLISLILKIISKFMWSIKTDKTLLLL